MEHVDKARAELKKYAKGIPELVAVCKQYNLPEDLVLGGGILVFVIALIVIQGYNIICALLTCVYPMICSIRTIESKNDEDTNTWLSFWCVFGIFQIVEMFFEFILAFIPYYYILRVAFFVFLMAPQTNGSALIYKSLISPFLKKHEDEIKNIITNIQKQADEAAKEGIAAANAAAKEHMTAENMMKGAAKVQEAQDKLAEAAGEDKAM